VKEITTIGENGKIKPDQKIICCYCLHTKQDWLKSSFSYYLKASFIFDKIVFLTKCLRFTNLNGHVSGGFKVWWKASDKIWFKRHSF
jgi:hypothetical protein